MHIIYKQFHKKLKNYFMNAQYIKPLKEIKNHLYGNSNLKHLIFQKNGYLIL